MDTRVSQDWTARQQREREFYSQFAKRHADEPVDFSPIQGLETRPWNPYWRVYQTVQGECTRPGLRLLDFGCGTGAASMVYARMGYQVTGFDICESNIEVSERRAVEYGLERNTQFAVMSAEHLEFADEQFDVVAGIDILHHVEIEPAIREVKRVLRPGGLAVFREFVEVPFFDRFRRSRLMTRWFPREASVDAHRTEDERKLTATDLQLIRNFFPRTEDIRFCLFSRIYRVLRRRRPERACPVERLDAHLFRLVPGLHAWGGELVLKLRKEGANNDDGRVAGA